MPKVSYLITVSTETDTLRKLLSIVGTVVKNSDDEVIVLIDSEAKDNQETKNILSEFAVKMGYEMIEKKTCKVLEHPLDRNYGAHKNFGIERSSGDFIFQIDGDEYPPDALIGENLHALLEANPTMEAYAVPRINDFRGVTPQHAAQWGWKLTVSPTFKRPVVNYPDFQFRIFKREYPRISFNRRLHEKIEGYLTYVCLPQDEEYALYHDKTIETQVKTNLRYNQVFTQAENQGHSVFK